MRKKYKICLIVFVIQFIFILFCNSYVEAGYNLKDFIKKYELEKMSDEEISSKIKKLSQELDEYNFTTATTVRFNASNDLTGAINKKNDEESMEYLESQFSARWEDDASDDNIAYLYSGYMLGQQWLIYKNSEEEKEKATSEGKTIAQQFDDKYNEYKNLSKDKKNEETLNKYNTELTKLYNQLPKADKTDERLKKLNEVQTEFASIDESVGDTADTIYKYPSKKDSTSAGSLDDMIGDADKFIDSADDAAISASSLQNFSKTFYNIFLTIGIIVATLVGSILGIKFMIGGAEEKAHIKELLVPYIVGCIVIFGAFAIWKIVVTILSSSFV